MTAPTQIPPVMPALRWRGRHVQQTVEAYIKDQMRQLGWVSDPVNLGGTPMTFIEFPPDPTGNSTPVAANTVAITFGDEPDELEEQLGGGLVTVNYSLFIDIYGESYSGSRSIAIDVKDILTRKYLQVYNFSFDPPEPVVGAWIEFENVSGPRTPGGAVNAEGFRKYWRVVTAQVLTTFSDFPGPGESVPNLVDLQAASAGSASAQAALFRRTPTTAAANGVATVAGDLSVAAGGGGGGGGGSPVISSTPPTDLHTDAPALDSLSGSVIFDLSTFSPDDGDLLGEGAWDDLATRFAPTKTARSAWVKYVCTTPGTMTFDTIGSGYDTYLRLLDSSGTEIAFDDDSAHLVGGGSGESYMTLGATVGLTYFIRISPYPSVTDGAGTLDQQQHTHFNWTVPG